MADSIIQLFTSSGSWKAPAGVNEIIVECWGGGGGTANPTSNNSGAGGGGGGAYAKKIIPVIPSQSYSYVIGAGGTNNGTAGGDTYWVNTSTVMAKGGSGSNGGTAGASGGAANSSVGDTKYSGGNGGAVVSRASGGGGGGAGSSGNGNNASGITGGTAKADYGGAGGNGLTEAGIGQNGSNYGGGAAGSYRRGTTGRDGTYGASGLIRIIYIIDEGPPEEYDTEFHFTSIIEPDLQSYKNGINSFILPNSLLDFEISGFKSSIAIPVIASRLSIFIPNIVRQAGYSFAVESMLNSVFELQKINFVSFLTALELHSFFSNQKNGNYLFSMPDFEIHGQFSSMKYSLLNFNTSFAASAIILFTIEELPSICLFAINLELLQDFFSKKSAAEIFLGHVELSSSFINTKHSFLQLNMQFFAEQIAASYKVVSHAFIEILSGILAFDSKKENNYDVQFYSSFIQIPFILKNTLFEFQLYSDINSFFANTKDVFFQIDTYCDIFSEFNIWKYSQILFDLFFLEKSLLRAEKEIIQQFNFELSFSFFLQILQQIQQTYGITKIKKLDSYLIIEQNSLPAALAIYEKEKPQVVIQNVKRRHSQKEQYTYAENSINPRRGSN